MSEFQSYFNYFTEIEEHFQRARGTSLFLLSPLDWALIESWKNTGIPLEVVLRGIDTAFEKWRARRSKVQMVNSLAFCSQAVLTEAQRAPAGSSGETADQSANEPFERQEIFAFLEANILQLTGRSAYNGIAESLTLIREQAGGDLEELERRLSVLEQKMIAIARSLESEEQALQSKQELERQVAPYRSKMSAPQIAMLERQFLERELLARENLPRLSLFYLR